MRIFIFFYPQMYNYLVLALNIDNSGIKTTVFLLGLFRKWMLQHLASLN